MKVKELIEKLMKVKNQDADIQIAQCDEDFGDLFGIALEEECDNVILCDKNTYEAFVE